MSTESTSERFGPATAESDQICGDRDDVLAVLRALETRLVDDEQSQYVKSRSLSDDVQSEMNQRQVAYALGAIAAVPDEIADCYGIPVRVELECWGESRGKTWIVSWRCDREVSDESRHDVYRANAATEGQSHE